MLHKMRALNPNISATNCPRPDDSYVSNGKFAEGEPAEVVPGGTFQFECDENYKLSGSEFITCESGSVFSGDYPTCTGEWRMVNLS